MFNGKSLKNIRILNGLSRKDLAIKVGITEQAIWQFENGYTTPRLEIINILKEIFHVKSIYFYRDDYTKNSLKNNICTDYIAYRSETISSVKKSQSESTHVRFIDGFLHFIEDQIKYPNETLSELREETIKYLQDNKDKPTNDQIHSIAMYARKKLGLSQSSNENLN